MTPLSLFVAFSVIAAAVLAAVMLVLVPIGLGNFIQWLFGR